MNRNILLMSPRRIIKLFILVSLVFTLQASAFSEKEVDNASVEALLALKTEDIILIDEKYRSINTSKWLNIPYSYKCGDFEDLPACSNDCMDTRKNDYVQCYNPFGCFGIELSSDEWEELRKVRFLRAEFASRNYAGVTIQKVSEKDANPYYYQVVFYLNCKQIEQTSFPIIDFPACFIRGDFRYCLTWIPRPSELEKAYRLTDNKIYFFSPSDRCYLSHECASILPIFDLREENNNIHGAIKIADIHDLTISILPYCTIRGKEYILGWKKCEK